MSQSALHLLRKRPFISTGLASACSVTAYASWVEYRTEQEASENAQGLSLPRTYDSKKMEEYYAKRPLIVASRVCTIGGELLPLGASILWDFYLCPFPFSKDSSFLQKKHAVNLKESLTRLGPAFVKGGQQLSIRPDLVPPMVLKELQTLCDSVEPVSDEIALKVLLKELSKNKPENDDLSKLFEDIKLVASASLGQVYKATLRENGKPVAIKVQRPDMIRKVSLDLLLLKKVGNICDAFITTFTKQAPFHYELFDNFARGSYMELDYEHEARNQIRFKEELAQRNAKVKIPVVYPQLTSRKVITMEWIDGVKLASAPQEQIRSLIPVGVELFLMQLLDIGAFHADPHPGNLYVSQDGTLCLLDFGLVAEVDDTSRNALTTAIFHLLTGDFDSLVDRDAKELGFLPKHLDTKELQPLLTKILVGGILEPGSNLLNRKRKLMEISNELNEVFFRYPFSVPPFLALVTRGLGLLEGIALSGDPNFDIFRASLPYARRRAVKIMGAEGLKNMRRTLTRSTPEVV